MGSNQNIKFRTNVLNKNKNDKFLSSFLGTIWKITPVLTTKFIKHFFFNPRKYNPTPEEITILETASTFSLKVHDKNLKGWKWGKGPGILFIHGWNGRGIQFYKFIEPLIGAGFSPIIIDGPAHGDSEGRHTSYFEFSDVVRHIMKHEDHLNIQGIVGHSFGASAAINCISKDKHPAKLVLIAPALYVKDTLDSAFSSHGVPIHIFNKIIGEYERFYGYNLKDDDPINLISDIDQEILIIHDKGDRATPFKHSEIAQGINSKIRLISTTGNGHSRILRSDKIVNDCIGFLSANEIDRRELSA